MNGGEGFHQEALVAFVAYVVGVFVLAIFSHRLLTRKSFVAEYFLGSRGLGLWALAMSYAATSASGGSFMGFPALIYQHGWILALWIASYMIVPITCMGMLGKRINHVARMSGAITVPDVFRDRFRNPGLGIVASLLLVFFLVFFLFAQFKAGATIMKILLGDLPLYREAAESVRWVQKLAFLTDAPQEPSYYLGLLIFSAAVIAYTAYGGFRAVVWTDVLQGIVMFFGVIILLTCTLGALDGGVEEASEKLVKMRLVPVVLESTEPTPVRVPPEFEIVASAAGAEWRFTTESGITIPGDGKTTVAARYRGTEPLPEALPDGAVLRAVGAGAASDGSKDLTSLVRVAGIRLSPRHDLVSPPGFDPREPDGFLPFALAMSFFVMWAISGAGQPTTMVRLMAFRDTKVFRRAMFSVCIYYSLIYIPLVVIFVSARTILPHLNEPDEAMPALVLKVVPGFLGGIILAAPFAAVMSTVDSMLLAISSSLVRDIFQRSVRPDASSKTIRRLSYASTVVIGCVVLLGAINPPRFLQDLIVLAGAGLACTFLAPMFFTLYWKRMTAAGVYAGMIGGFGTSFGLFVIGWIDSGRFQPYNLGGFLPVVWGILASMVLSVVVSLFSRPPSRELVDFYFKVREPR